MKPIFTASHQTQELVALFTRMSTNETFSYEAASKKLGFAIYSTLPSYQSAKRIAERDHGCVVSSVRKYGFKRIDGEQMVKRAPAFFKRVRRGARREAMVQEIAISQNLPRDEMLKATEQLSRLRILETTAVSVRAASNRRHTDTPETMDHDNRKAIGSIRR